MILFGIAISLRAFFPGEIQVWINGTTVMNIKGLQMRNTTASVFRGMHFQTFFGGALFSFANVLDADRVFRWCGQVVRLNTRHQKRRRRGSLIFLELL